MAGLRSCGDQGVSAQPLTAARRTPCPQMTPSWTMAAASAGTPAGTAWIKLAGAFDVTPSALITALVTDRRSVRLADGERLA